MDRKLDTFYKVYI